MQMGLTMQRSDPELFTAIFSQISCLVTKETVLHTTGD